MFRISIKKDCLAYISVIPKLMQVILRPTPLPKKVHGFVLTLPKVVALKVKTVDIIIEFQIMMTARKKEIT